jgi:hypothetical protein
MATINSTLYDKQKNGGASNLPNSKEYFGRVRHAYIEVNTTATPVNNGDIINLCELPVGARVIGLNVYYTAMGAGATLIIGDAANTSRYLASTSVATAGNVTTIAASGFGYVVDDGKIIATAGGANYASGQTLKVVLYYVLD